MKRDLRQHRAKSQNHKADPMFPFSGSMILTLQGSRELLVENYQGILQFDQHLLSLKSKREQLLIYGEELSIHYYTKDELKVSGTIRRVEVVPGP